MTNNEEVLPTKLQKSVNKIIRDENFTTHTIQARIVPTDGGSFMGILREINIKGQTEKGDKEINLFVKTIIPEVELTIYSVPGVYERETTMYTDVFKLFNELQEEAKVPFEHRYHSPKTYEGVDSESIIMENLKLKGFTMCDRMKVMPIKFAELTIQQMARFHGMAFVIQAKRPEFFETHVKSFKNPYYHNTPEWDMFVGNTSRMAITILDPKARERAEAYLPTTFEKYSRYANDPNSVRTFVHNDFRNNNVMVKFSGDEISQVMLIDFQQAFYGCPVIDFFYFIFSGSDQEFRRQHLEHLKNLYHNTMAQFLKCFDLDIESYFPRKEYERLYNERLDYGLMVSLWLVPIVLADPGDLPDVTRVKLNSMNFRMNETVRSRVKGAVDDFIKWGYL